MAEDTSEQKVLGDLNKLEINDLRLLASQSGLRFDGEKIELLERIKLCFGFGDKNQESNDENLQRNEELNKKLQSCTGKGGKT